jgi:serine/threonine protein kinase
MQHLLQVSLEALLIFLLSSSPAILKSTYGSYHGCSAFICLIMAADSIPWLKKRGDLWSLGCVLYALFHGQSPFHDNVDYHALIKVKSGVVAYPSESNVNAEAKDLIGKLLVCLSVDAALHLIQSSDPLFCFVVVLSKKAPNPDDRPTIADALQHDFLSSA